MTKILLFLLFVKIGWESIKGGKTNSDIYRFWTQKKEPTEKFCAFRDWQLNDMNSLGFWKWRIVRPNTKVKILAEEATEKNFWFAWGNLGKLLPSSISHQYKPSSEKRNRAEVLRHWMTQINKIREKVIKLQDNHILKTKLYNLLIIYL